MLARLWWKELRELWPLWAAVGLIALAVQGLVMHYAEPATIRSGTLPMIALMLTNLYAFASGATAFAGERETKTLRLLDTLPVGRRTLWAGKATFALATTLALALVLVLAAVAGAAWHGPIATPPAGFPIGLTAIVLGSLLIEAVSWGLLWSALLENVLLAAILAITCTGVVVSLTSILVGEWTPLATLAEKAQVLETVPFRLAIALGALGLSWAIITRHPRPGRLRRARPANSAVPAATRPAGAPRFPAFRSLAWQAAREARTTCLVLLGGAGVALVMAFGGFEVGLPEILGIFGVLGAGVGVFGIENRAASNRFLVHHGVRPRTVWLAKVSAWATLLAFPGAILIGRVVAHTGRVAPALNVYWYPAATATATAFAVALLCGMTVGRGITAGGLAGLLTPFAVLPFMALAAAEMIPPWSLALMPLALLAASFGWTGDWMLDRGGPRRWVRLAGLLAVPAVGLMSLYVGYRAFSVPDVGPPFDVAALRSRTVPAVENAADLYRRALAAYHETAGPRANIMDTTQVEIEQVIAEGWNPETRLATDWWRANRESLDLARRATALPHLQFRSLAESTLATPEDPALQDLRKLSRLLMVEARERMSRGDLEGAWGDIRAIFRMGRHAEEAGGLIARLIGIAIHAQAASLGMSWAADARQTPESLRAAGDDLRKLPPAPPIAEAIKVEYAQIDRLLDLPTAEFHAALDGLGGMPFGSGHSYGYTESALGKFLMDVGFTAPWERTRSRRALRLLFAELLQDAGREPWRRPPGSRANPGATEPLVLDGRILRGDELRDAFQTTPLVRLLYPAVPAVFTAVDQESVRQAALEQILALRSWQLRHDGAYPGALADLVPSELPKLPADPFFGRPFGYVRSSGQLLPPLGSLGTPSSGSLRPTRPGQWLLYSVGPDRTDNHAAEDYWVSPRRMGDLVFPLPERGD